MSQLCDGRDLTRARILQQLFVIPTARGVLVASVETTDVTACYLLISTVISRHLIDI